jgi:uncharacterized protein (DUF58 family)
LNEPIVVPHKRRNLHGLFSFLTVVWVAVLIRGYGAGVWVVALFGALLLGTLALWLHLTRHPPRLEISHHAIRYWHKGKPRAQELVRESGELYIRRSGGRYPQPYLCVVGSDQVGIALNISTRTRSCGHVSGRAGGSSTRAQRFSPQNPGR